MGIVLASQLETAFRHEFDRFLIDFRNPPMAKNMQKPLVFVGQNKEACFYAMIALMIGFGSNFGPVLGAKLGPQDRPKTRPRGVQRGVNSELFSGSPRDPSGDPLGTILGSILDTFYIDFAIWMHEQAHHNYRA